MCCADSSQLCLRFAPLAAIMLAVSLPLIEPSAITDVIHPKTEAFTAAEPVNTGFVATPLAILTILLSAALGLLVTLSTFLVIGATSALTYNVVGHLKTGGVILGGVMLYDEVCGSHTHLSARRSAMCWLTCAR
jgi:solute carrier family 35, member E3